MKASIISAIALASVATAAPLVTRQAQAARIELEIESDTFIQGEIPLNVAFRTTENPRLARGISASVVTPDGVRCQAFDVNEQPLGAPFGDVAVQFSDEPVEILGYICKAGGNNDDAQDDVNDNVEVGQGQARIQLEVESDTFVQEEIPVGVEVSTDGEYRPVSHVNHSFSFKHLAEFILSPFRPPEIELWNHRHLGLC